MSKLDIIGLVVGIVGIVITLRVAWHIFQDEMEEGDSLDEIDFGSMPEDDHNPDSDSTRGEKSRRNIALDMVDRRVTRSKGDPMPALVRGTKIGFDHGQRYLTGTVYRVSGRRVSIVGEFRTRRKIHEVNIH